MYLGCAGWQLSKTIQERFPGQGTHLQRYARQLPACEINSSFYRHHRRALYAKWASEVPGGFRFAVKLPRALTHRQRLRSQKGLDAFLEEVGGLEEKLGPFLVQLPPSLAFEPEAVERFLAALRERFQGGVVCEPRHSSWFTDAAEALLSHFRVSRVAADPPPVEGADEPGGWRQQVYLRLHGRPRRFYSSYEEAFLQELAERLRRYEETAETWCIFNNTASQAGLENALTLSSLLQD